MTQAAYARHRGCDPRDVRRALESGLIRREEDGAIDPVRADKEWTAGVNPGSAKQPGMKRHETTLSPGGQTSFNEARTASEMAKAEMSSLRLKERLGELVNRAKAADAIFALARQERDSWVSWPARIAAILAAELKIDAHLMEIALDRQVKAHLRTLAAVDVERVLSQTSKTRP
jgi:hypothetical protein